MTAGSKYIRRSGIWKQLSDTNTPGPVDLPTGPGIYTYATALSGGATDIQSALTWVKAQSGGVALTFPAGTYPIVPSFTQNPASQAGCCIFAPAGISIYGQGPAYTKFQLNGALTMDTVPSGAGTTNQYYVLRTTGGGPTPVTLSNFSLDCSTLAANAPSYKGAYASGTTYAAGDMVMSGSSNALFRSLQASNVGHTPVGTQASGPVDAWWEFIAFSGVMVHIETNPVVTNVLVKGNYGYANIPPGETHGINAYMCTGTVTMTDVEIDGNGVSGSLLGLESMFQTCTYNITRAFTHNAGHGHGVASYRSTNMTFTDCVSIDNGFGTGGSTGDGFNHEESYIDTTQTTPPPAVHHIRSKANHGNTFCSARFEAGDNGGVDVTNFLLESVTFTNSVYAIKCMGADTISNASTTSGSTTLTTATSTFIFPSSSPAPSGSSGTDIGTAISGPGIPAGTVITAVTSATQVTLSHAATATGSGVTVQIRGQRTIPTYDSASILRGSTATNASTQTVYPLPCVYVGA